MVTVYFLGAFCYDIGIEIKENDEVALPNMMTKTIPTGSISVEANFLGMSLRPINPQWAVGVLALKRKQYLTNVSEDAETAMKSIVAQSIR